MFNKQRHECFIGVLIWVKVLFEPDVIASHQPVDLAVHAYGFHKTAACFLSRKISQKAKTTSSVSFIAVSPVKPRFTVNLEQPRGFPSKTMFKIVTKQTAITTKASPASTNDKVNYVSCKNNV